MIYIVLLVVVVGLLYYFVTKNKKETEPEIDITPDEPVIPEHEKTLENVLAVEEYVAVCGGIDGEAKLIYDDILNALYEVIPEMVEYKATEIGFEISNIANKNLLAKMKSFLALSDKDKITQYNTLVGDLSKFKEYILKAKNIVDLNDLSKDERESMLIDIKY